MNIQYLNVVLINFFIIAIISCSPNYSEYVEVNVAFSEDESEILVAKVESKFKDYGILTHAKRTRHLASLNIYDTLGNIISTIFENQKNISLHMAPLFFMKNAGYIIIHKEIGDQYTVDRQIIEKISYPEFQVQVISDVEPGDASYNLRFILPSPSGDYLLRYHNPEWGESRMIFSFLESDNLVQIGPYYELNRCRHPPPIFRWKNDSIVQISLEENNCYSSGNSAIKYILGPHTPITVDSDANTCNYPWTSSSEYSFVNQGYINIGFDSDYRKSKYDPEAIFYEDSRWRVHFLDDFGFTSKHRLCDEKP